ncbi:MAG: hypothetical protein K0Q64_1447, partial [Nitrobacter vulgaris]|nr:hypothetical protein [Nitrobacter vulgaris]
MGNSSGLDKGLMALIQNVLGTRHNAPLPEAELPEDNPRALSESLGAETSTQPEAMGPVEET